MGIYRDNLAYPFNNARCYFQQIKSFKQKAYVGNRTGVKTKTSSGLVFKSDKILGVQIFFKTNDDRVLWK